MKKEKSSIFDLLSWLAIAGNIFFVLWILYNTITYYNLVQIVNNYLFILFGLKHKELYL